MDEADETNNTGYVGLRVVDNNGDGVAEACEAVSLTPNETAEVIFDFLKNENVL